MSATRVQSIESSDTGYGGSFDFSFGSNLTSGNMIYIAAYHGGAASITSITDTASNTYTRIHDSGGSPPYADGSAFYAYNITGGSVTITVNFSDYTFACLVAREYSGLTTTDPLDVKAENLDGSYTTSHPTGTTSTTAQDNELVVGCYVADGLIEGSFSVSAGSLINLQDEQNGTYGSLCMADKDVTSTGTQTATFSTGATYSNGWASIATFKETSTVVELDPNDIALSLTTDNTTITQNHIVASNDISLGLTVDATTISINYDIDTNDISIGLSMDNTTVDHNHVLSPDDILLTLSEDVTTITQVHDLSVNDIALSLGLDADTITQVHILAPDDMSLDLSADSTTMTQVHVLSSDDIAMGLMIDISQVTQAKVLAITLSGEVLVGTISGQPLNATISGETQTNTIEGESMGVTIKAD